MRHSRLPLPTGGNLAAQPTRFCPRRNVVETAAHIQSPITFLLRLHLTSVIAHHYRCPFRCRCRLAVSSRPSQAIAHSLSSPPFEPTLRILAQPAVLSPLPSRPAHRSFPRLNPRAERDTPSCEASQHSSTSINKIGGCGDHHQGSALSRDCVTLPDGLQ